jgi:hypothetical protein
LQIPSRLRRFCILETLLSRISLVWKLPSWISSNEMRLTHLKGTRSLKIRFTLFLMAPFYMLRLHVNTDFFAHKVSFMAVISSTPLFELPPTSRPGLITVMLFSPFFLMAYRVVFPFLVCPLRLLLFHSRLIPIRGGLHLRLSKVSPSLSRL